MICNECSKRCDCECVPYSIECDENFAHIKIVVTPKPSPDLLKEIDTYFEKH